MKKLLLVLPILMLGGCSDAFLKYTNPSEYEQKMAEEQCHQYLTQRKIEVDGVAGYYEYNTNENGAFSCYAVGEDIIQPYDKPEIYGANHPDLYLRPQED